jgi:hypothetical protein
MKLSAMMFLAAVAALCFGCAHREADGGPRNDRTLKLTGTRTCDAGSFAASARILPTGYQPYNSGSGTFNPLPSGLPSLSPASPIYQDLFDAFNAAPKEFQDQLCGQGSAPGLDGLYIDQRTVACGNFSSCLVSNSWGFRDPTNAGSLKRYIGLSVSLWRSLTQPRSAPVYSAYESDLLAQVIQARQKVEGATIAPGQWGSMTVAEPYFSKATSNASTPPVEINTSATTVLAALAHEFGHILWYDSLRSDPNGIYNPKNFCINTGTGFFDNAWSSVTQPGARWVDFATNQDQPKGLLPHDVITALSNSNPSTAADYLNKLYANDSTSASSLWPSLFAALSPQEDFAETYKIYILTHKKTNGGNPLTSMILNISDGTNMYTPNIFADLDKNGGNNKKELKRKTKCFGPGQ